MCFVHLLPHSATDPAMTSFPSKTKEKWRTDRSRKPSPPEVGDSEYFSDLRGQNKGKPPTTYDAFTYLHAYIGKKNLRGKRHLQYPSHTRPQQGEGRYWCWLLVDISSKKDPSGGGSFQIRIPKCRQDDRILDIWLFVPLFK